MDQTATATTRYAAQAIVLHWAIAVLLAFQLGLGWRLEDLPKGVAQFTAFQLHKSVGILILLLSLARLGVRYTKPRPPLLEDKPAVLLLAKSVHGLLYLAMIGGPLAGWVLVSTGKVRLQTMLFGTIPWPNLPLGPGWHEPAEVVHSALALLLAGLIALHVGGALRHHWLRRDYLGRMLTGPSWIAALALAALAAAYGASTVWPFGGSEPAELGQVAVVPAPSREPIVSDAPSRSDTPSPSESASPAAEQAGKWMLQGGGRLTFRASYSGTPVNGSFDKWDADILFSPDDLDHSRIKVTVDLASVSTADSERDDMLRSDSFFAAATHPRALFTSSRITARGPGRYVANGTLSLHGQQRPLALNFDLRIEGDMASASGSARLNRLSYGVGSGEWATTDPIADDVGIAFRLKARRAR